MDVIMQAVKNGEFRLLRLTPCGQPFPQAHPVSIQWEKPISLEQIWGAVVRRRRWIQGRQNSPLQVYFLECNRGLLQQYLRNRVRVPL